MTSNQDKQDPSLTKRVAEAARDVRALGLGAPLRAAYETSKRIGGHYLVFGRLVPSDKQAASQSNPFSFGDVPPIARDRTLAAADRIVIGNIELFSQELMLGDPPGWHSLVHTTGSWPAVEWWKIDLRSDDRPGDVKWAWELGRHRHLVILARAAYLDPSNSTYADTLNRQLSSWLKANPPEIGVHWYSNLEIALRALAWLQILALAGGDLDETVQSEMWKHLRHSGRHLIADLPYTVSTMRNNHLLGDALGLIALGKALGGSAGDRWIRVGDRLFEGQLRRHMHPDGSMIEDSLSYHRFVLEMLAMRVVIGDASDSVADALERSAQFLVRLGALDGPVPQYGDWDEGRVIAVSGNAGDLPGSIYLALALSDSGAPAEWREQYDEVAWFAPEGNPVSPQEPETLGADIGGDISRAQIGDHTVWLKGGHGPSHGHADLSSVSVAWKGQRIIGDPGTGFYNDDIELRNELRSSVSHCVARIDGTDQLVPHRVFRWRYDAAGRIGEPIEFEGVVIMWSVHNAYARLQTPRRLVRLVAVSSDAVEIADVAEGEGARLVTSIPLGPDCSWDGETSEIALSEGRWTLSPQSTTIDGIQDHDAAWSSTYGDISPARRLEMTVDDSSRSVWSISQNGHNESILSDVVVQFRDDSVTVSFPPDSQLPERSIVFPR